MEEGLFSSCGEELVPEQSERDGCPLSGALSLVSLPDLDLLKNRFQITVFPTLL